MIHGDLREVDLSDATVVITYLLPEAMADLAESHLLPLLRVNSEAEPTSSSAGSVGSQFLTKVTASGSNNKRGCRIVCNTWGIPGARAVKEEGVGPYEGVKLRLFTSDSLI